MATAHATGAARPYEGSADLFMEEIRNRFGDTDRVATKIIKLRTLSQGDRTAEEHIQDFRKNAIGSGYEGRALIEEFKRSLNRPLKEKIMLSEIPPVDIEGWY